MSDILSAIENIHKVFENGNNMIVSSTNSQRPSNKPVLLPLLLRVFQTFL